MVIGAGAIGLELAAAYARFGSQVTVIDSVPDLLPHEDRDVADAVARVLTADGIDLVLGATVRGIEDAGDKAGDEAGEDVVVDVLTTAGPRQLRADRVLVSVGRRPATDDLGLEAAGIAVDARGAVVVDDHLRTTAAGVWALGDVNGGPQFTAVSLDDFRIVRDQLLGDGLRTTTDRRAVPTTTFITPPLSRVGLTEAEARAAGRPVKVASKAVEAIAAMPRSRIVGDTRGLVKVVVDAETDRVLGATVFCVDSQEIVNLLALAIRHDVTAAELRDSIYTHPSSTEALNEVLATI